MALAGAHPAGALLFSDIAFAKKSLTIERTRSFRRGLIKKIPAGYVAGGNFSVDSVL
jgi:hypothetical protein